MPDPLRRRCRHSLQSGRCGATVATCPIGGIPWGDEKTRAYEGNKMKKLLLASTALAASAGMAAAEVSPNITLTGYAEMGIVGGGGDLFKDEFGNNERETQFWSDFDMNITFAAETDNGLVFGADIDLDEVANGEGISATGGPGTGGYHTVFISGSFGTFTLGDTDGAFDWAMIEIDSLTTIDDAHTVHLGFNGNAGLDGMYDGQILRYDYAFESFAVALSLELDDTGINDPVYGIGATYTFNAGTYAIDFGIGYQGASYRSDNENYDTDKRTANLWGISAAFDIYGFEVELNYTDASSFPLADIQFSDGTGLSLAADPSGAPADWNYWGIGVTYEYQAWAFNVNYGQYDIKSKGDLNGDNLKAKSDGVGVAVMYEIGEGISAAAGYSNQKWKPDFDSDRRGDLWSLGLVMTF
jgi:outer membrane protein OmpU